MKGSKPLPPESDLDAYNEIVLRIGTDDVLPCGGTKKGYGALLGTLVPINDLTYPYTKKLEGECKRRISNPDSGAEHQALLRYIVEMIAWHKENAIAKLPFVVGDLVECLNFDDEWVRKSGCVVGGKYVIESVEVTKNIRLHNQDYVLNQSCFKLADVEKSEGLTFDWGDTDRNSLPKWLGDAVEMAEDNHIPALRLEAFNASDDAEYVPINGFTITELEYRMREFLSGANKSNSPKHHNAYCRFAYNVIKRFLDNN